MPIEFAPPPPATQGYQITPPQSTDPLQTLAQMGQLRTQGLQQQSAQLGLQQQQLKMQSQKAMVNAFAQGGTPDQIYQRAIASGQVLPEDAIAFQQHQMKYQTDAAALDEKKRAMLSEDIGNYVGAASQATDQASLDAANAAAAKRGLFDSKKFDPIAQYPGDNTHFQAQLNGLLSHKQILDQTKTQGDIAEAAGKTALSGVQTTEAQQKVDAGNLAAATSAIQRGEIDPQTGTPTPATVAQVQAQYPKVRLPQGNAPKAVWDRFLTGDLSPKERMELAMPKDETALAVIANDPNRPQDERDRATNALKTLKTQKDVVNTEAELARVATDPTKTPEQQAAANAALKRLDQSKLASRPIINNIIPGVPTAPATGAAAELHGEDFLKTLPASFAARIRQMATGDLPAPTGRSATTGAGLQLMNALMQYDPQYSTLLGKGRTDELKQFTDTHPGSAGGQLIALNTMLHHADLYMDAAAALKNGTFKPGNEIYNKVATIFGAAPPTNAALLAQFFASETGKIATGGVPAEGEVKSILQKMSTDGSPEAMEGAAKTLIGIAAGRMIPLKDRRDKWKLDKLVDILGPDAKDVLQRRGFDPETMKPVQRGGAGGSAPLIKTKADYDKLPSGTVYTGSDGKSYRKP
jgi:hypothetical protein